MAMWWFAWYRSTGPGSVGDALHKVRSENMNRSLAHSGFWLLVVTFGLGLFASSLPAVTLVEQGKPRAVIVLTQAALAYQPPGQARRGRKPQAADPIADERLAAAELQNYVEQISGARLQMVTRDQVPTGRTPIYVGEAADNTPKTRPVARRRALIRVT